MAFAAALGSVAAYIALMPEGAIANGTTVANTAMPSTAHVDVHSQWALTNDAHGAAAFSDFATALCHATGAEQAALPAGRMSLAAGLIVVIARKTLARAAHLSPANLNPIETTTIATLQIHANHQAALITAIHEFAEAAPRAAAIAYYNAISFASSNHHHLPAKTKKLASTTMHLTGLTELFAADPTAEGFIMHDAFHPLTMVWKSEAARNTNSTQLLEDLGFNNLARRLPVKAPDTGLSMNYAALIAKARDFPHDVATLPVGLNPTAALGQHVRNYVNAAAAAQALAVAQLRNDATHLGKPSAYVAGYLLGKVRTRDGDADMSLAGAGKTMTILGSPVLRRVAEEYPGTFAQGLAAGAGGVSAIARTAAANAVLTSIAAAVQAIA